VGRAAGFSGPGAERLDDYRLGWILVSKVCLRFGSAALRVRESVGCGVDPGHVTSLRWP
jgi:hypothetical protein